MSFKRIQTKINRALLSFLPKKSACEQTLLDAINYSLISGGKRIRPILLLEFLKLCGKKEDIGLPFAAAVEMIHTYSLIHDDLPCMDNAALRRGKPSSHKRFSESTAILAGDALLTLAFEILAAQGNSKQTLKCIKILANAAGSEGMISGQILDLASKNKAADLKYL